MLKSLVSNKRISSHSKYHYPWKKTMIIFEAYKLQGTETNELMYFLPDCLFGALAFCIWKKKKNKQTKKKTKKLARYNILIQCSPSIIQYGKC